MGDFPFWLRGLFRRDEREALRGMVAAEVAARVAYERQFDEAALAMRALARSGTPTVCVGQSVDCRGNPYPVLLRHDAALSGGHMLFSGVTGGGKSALGVVLLSQLLGRDPFRTPQIIAEPKSDIVPIVRDVLVPSLVAVFPEAAAEALASRFVCLNVFDPTSPVPFQVLTRDPTLTIEEQGFEVSSSFTRTVGLRDVGPLQETTLRYAMIAGIDLGLNVAEVVRFLRDEVFRRGLVPRIAHPETRHYFEQQFRRERPSGLAALLNRLDSLLAVPGLRRLLESRGMVRFPDLLEGYITVIDLGGAPAGMREAQRFIGELIIARLVRAVFARRVTPASPPVGLWLDEFQELLTPELAADAERVLTLARARRCFLRLFHQSGAQFSDNNFLRIVRSMTNFHAVFRSDEQDARHLEPFLPIVRDLPAAGETADMSETAERAARRQFLELVPRLPDRTFLWWDKRQGHPAILARTPTYPFADARRRAASLPRDLREALRTGAVDRVTEEQEPRVAAVEESHGDAQGRENPAAIQGDDEAARGVPVARETPATPTRRARTRRVQLG